MVHEISKVDEFLQCHPKGFWENYNISVWFSIHPTGETSHVWYPGAVKIVEEIQTHRNMSTGRYKSIMNPHERADCSAAAALSNTTMEGTHHIILTTTFYKGFKIHQEVLDLKLLEF